MNGCDSVILGTRPSVAKGRPRRSMLMRLVLRAPKCVFKKARYREIPREGDI